MAKNNTNSASGVSPQAPATKAMEKYFKLYPSVAVFYKTKDGTVFLESQKNAAENHAKRIGSEIETIVKSKLKKDDEPAS